MWLIATEIEHGILLTKGRCYLPSWHVKDAFKLLISWREELLGVDVLANSIFVLWKVGAVACCDNVCIDDIGRSVTCTWRYQCRVEDFAEVFKYGVVVDWVVGLTPYLIVLGEEGWEDRFLHIETVHVVADDSRTTYKVHLWLEELLLNKYLILINRWLPHRQTDVCSLGHLVDSHMYELGIVQKPIDIIPECIHLSWVEEGVSDKIWQLWRFMSGEGIMQSSEVSIR